MKIKNILENFLSVFNIKYHYLKLIELVSEILKKTLIRNVDANLLIFGGDDFTGNTKYLFLFLNSFSNYRIVWLSKSRNIVKKLRKKGFEAYNRISLKSLFLLLRAKYIFITHGFNDIIPINLSSGTKLVYLAHGIPFKRPNFDAKNFNKMFPTRYDLELMIKLFKTMDYHISCSNHFNNILKKAYKISNKKIVNTGYPRNDLFFIEDYNFIKNLKKNYNIPDYIENIILYAPTFREHRIAKFPLNQEQLRKLNDYFKITNSILLLKAHKFEKIIDFTTLNNIKIINQKEDIQPLLLISNLLITDYSSVFLDYLLTLNPIIFFAYDLEFFRETRGEFYFNYGKFVPGPIVKDGSELIETVKDSTKWIPNYKDRLMEIRKFAHRYIDGNSCQRISKLLKLNLNIKKNDFNLKKWYQL